jgi:hypothetical protein
VVYGVAVSLIEMLESQLKTLDLEHILRVMQDPRQALREAFGGKRGRRESDARRISNILMRRTSATTMGDKVLRDVETQYHVA